VSIGMQIKKHRIDNGLTQKVLANKAKNLTQSQISKIETGNRKVTVTELSKFQRILNIPIDELI